MKRRVLTCSLMIVAWSTVRAQTRPLVDHHQHLFSAATVALVSPPTSPARDSSAPGRAATPAPAIHTISAADLIALLDSAGTRRAVVLSLGYTWGSPNRTVENEYEKVKAENDWTSQQVAQYPDRLTAFCSFNPIRDYALAELDRCARDPRLRSGLKLHFANSVVDVHDAKHIEQVRRVFRKANDYRMPIVVHARSSISRRLPYGREEARIFLDEILPEAPDVVVQIGHLAGAGGYDDPTTDDALAVFAEAVEKKDPRTRRLYVDVSGRAFVSTGKADLVVRRIRQLGVERILFGSDAATGGNLAPREAWAEFRKLPLSEKEFRTIAANVAPYLRAASPARAPANARQE